MTVQAFVTINDRTLCFLDLSILHLRSNKIFQPSKFPVGTGLKETVNYCTK
jgi:hypothetical protein